jgi:O-antigen ligase
MLCSIALFVISHRFVNAELTPKWMGVMLTIGIMGILWSVRHHRILLPIRQMDTTPIFGTIVVFVLALSVQGFLQYAGIISSANRSFTVTGNFDNPSGFASAIACATPLCFLFFTHHTKYIRYAAIASATMMAIAVILSGSRAGMLAIVAATIVWLFAKSKMAKQKINIALVVALVVLPIILYFSKKDSADGRLLIWRCTLDMIADKPVFGHGQGAFKAKYMLYQAAYFKAHPDSQYATLADNVLHPFNEYLLILAGYGVVGLAVAILLVCILLRAYRRNPGDEKLVALMSLLALSVHSFFSYPFRYPFTWGLLFLNAVVICNPCRIVALRVLNKKIMIVRAIVFMLFAGLTTYTVILTQAHIRWNSIARLSLMGQTRKVLPEYERLYRWLGKDGLFLYNHAAELHEAKEYEKSIAVFEQCTCYYNDMDVQMLLANNYKQLGRYTDAEQHLKTAAAMCPVRFMPLYELAKLYDATGRRGEALAMAKAIVDKYVKIPSPTVTTIKNEMREWLKAKESVTDDPVNDNRASDHPLNNETRQGEAPEVQPRGAALPP